MKTKVKELRIYMVETLLRDFMADYETIYPECIEIEKVVEREGRYFVDYIVDDSYNRTEVEVHPLELMEMLNVKINKLIEKYESREENE
jgi:hypothetical protein